MQKIMPCLWFDTQAGEAAKFYTSLFGRSKILSTSHYGDAGPMPKGTVLVVNFQLEGLNFMALNGGPAFSFTPAISLFVTCTTEEEVDGLWQKLSEGGKVLMELQKYPFSEKFGWVADRFGLTWQLNLTRREKRIDPFLMFVGKQNGKAEEAMKFYASLFKDSRVEQVERFGAGRGEPENSVSHGRFLLAGQQFLAMDSSRDHAFTFTPAVSLFVNCETQAEVDELWQKLTEGGKESQCGWLDDRYGVSWQIVPTILGELMQSKDPRKAKQVMEAMLKMRKLDVKKLQEAYAR
jgi:predicted 3-demethylubiquinone-9 3-methyltransferase (glyoxalase superfamily)